jgi:hypothetical protein
MVRRLKVERRSHFVLELFDLHRNKLDNAAALGTDHVVVMVMIVMMLKVRFVIAEPDLAS